MKCSSLEDPEERKSSKKISELEDKEKQEHSNSKLDESVDHHDVLMDAEPASVDPDSGASRQD